MFTLSRNFIRGMIPVNQFRKLTTRNIKRIKMNPTVNHKHIFSSPFSLIISREYNPGRNNQNKSSFKKPNIGTIASMGAAATMLFGKTKYLFAGLKLFKVTPVLSMVISSGAYAMIFGPAFGCGMVGMIFVHELGHLIAMRHYGMKFSPMVFIPFMGASILMESSPRNAWEEAVIAFGGPVFGGAAAGAVSIYAMQYDSQFAYALANWGYMINLFNMLPVGQMDGGRIANSISPYFGMTGLVGGWYLAYEGIIGNPIFYLILMMGTFEQGSQLLGYKEVHQHYKLNYGRQSTLAAAYVALIAALLAGMALNDVKRKTPKQIEREKSYGWNENENYPWHKTNGDGRSHDGGKYDDYFGGRSDRF